MELEPLRHPTRLDTEGTNQDIEPLITGEPLSTLNKGVEIKPGELDRLQLFDVECVIVVLDIVVRHGAFCPNAAFEYTVVFALVITLVDCDARGVEVLHARPRSLLLLVVAHVDLVDKGVPSLLLDEHLGTVAFVRPDVVFLDRVQHSSQAFLYLPRIVARAVSCKQELKNEGRNIRPFLDLQQKVFANHFPWKYLIQLFVERIVFHSKYAVLSFNSAIIACVAGSIARTVKFPENCSSIRRPTPTIWPGRIRMP